MLEKREAGLHIVILGLSITSAWGNGHATTYRSLVRELARAGHRVTFLERDVPWYAAHRDAPAPLGAMVVLYRDLDDLFLRCEHLVRRADVVIVGWYVPEGTAVGHWAVATARGITAFYDIDTPITLRNLANDECEYLEPSLVALYDLYLSFTGGATLRFIESHYGSPAARHLACSVDPEAYRPAGSVPAYALGYLGTYSDDRQPAVDRLLFETARRLPMDAFVVAGASYPKTLGWPRNVQHVEHVAPREHPAFYCSQRATLNVTRADMVLAGFSPSVRLFEAAACGVAIISDRWAGIETYFDPGTEIVLADCSDDVIGTLTELDPRELEAIGMRSRARVLREHTARARARELLGFLGEHRGGLRAVG